MSLLAGTGRAVRHGNLIAYSAAPIAELADLLAVGSTEVFKRLAALVVRHQFDLPAFAVIDATARRAFVFGDLSLRGPGGAISGGQATTWVEATVADVDLLACGPEATPADRDTDLVEGTVPAGGFVLSTAPTPSATELRPDTVALPATTALQDVPPNPAPELPLLAEPLPGAEPEPWAEPAPVGVHETDLASAEAPGRTTTTHDRAPARLSILDQPADWNPLANPVGVDLASLGRMNHPPAATTSGAGGGRPSTVGPAPEAPPAPPAPPDNATIALRRPLGIPGGPEAEIPPPPTSPVPPASVTFDDDPGATLPEIPSLTVTADLAEGPVVPARLRCDDGQLIEVQVGAYVGRHPTKGGLPEGYVAVTVRGEHVSRVHWKLTVAGDGLLVADLGSASGTSIQLPGWKQAAALEGTAPTIVLPGTTVHFADRWAVVEV